MNYKLILGILLIIFGLIFAIYPTYSAGAVSFIAGISLIAFGFAAIIDGFSLWSMMAHISGIEILLGMLAMLFGLLFIYNIDALSFLVSFQFYLIAFILIFIGILGLFSGSETISKLTSILIIILGIIAIFLAAFSLAQPLYVAIIVGICLIMQGITFIAAGITEN